MNTDELFLGPVPLPLLWQAAAVLVVVIGLVFSVLGEWCVVARAPRHNERSPSGARTYSTRQMLRAALHTTTAVFWGVAVLLWRQADGSTTGADVALATSGTAASCVVICWAALRGR